jgi:hypothetical protein
MLRIEIQYKSLRLSVIYLFIHSFILLLYMRGDPSKGCDSSVEGAPGMRGHQVGVAVVAVAGLFMWSHYFVL